MSWKNRFRPAVHAFNLWLCGRHPRLVAFYLRWFWKPQKPIERIVHEHSIKQKRFSFLQIGANDGRINDPLFNFIFRDGWCGLRVEPLETPFKDLTKLHRGTPNVKLLQALVAERSGDMPLYRLSFSNKRWASGLSSLDASHVQKQIDSGYVESRARKYGDALPKEKEPWIVSQVLPVLEINQLLQERFQGRLNLLQIDTEGFDQVLVDALELERLHIDLIGFEKIHIPEEKLVPCLQRLEQAGYSITVSDVDVLAWKK